MFAQVTGGVRFLCFMAISAFISSNFSDAAILSPTDLFEIQFSTTVSNADIIKLSLSRSDINSGDPPTPIDSTSIAASLFNGNTMLGTYIGNVLVDPTPGGGASYSFYWKSSSSAFEVLNSPHNLNEPTVIDFTSIADGTIDGRIQLSIIPGGGPIEFYFDNRVPEVITGIGGRNSILLDGSVEIKQFLLNGTPINPVPEPTAVAVWCVLGSVSAALTFLKTRGHDRK